MIGIIVLTPRAGTWNHRYLVSGKEWQNEYKVDYYLAQAKKKLIGDDFVVVKQRVQQRTSGRSGEEYLIFVHKGLSSLDESFRRELQRELEQRLSALSQLIDSEIDWDTWGREYIIVIPKLSRWREQIIQKMEIKTASRHWVTKMIIAILLMGVLGVVAVLFRYWDDISDFPIKAEDALCSVISEDPDCRIERDDNRLVHLCELLGISNCSVETMGSHIRKIAPNEAKRRGLNAILNRYLQTGELNWHTVLGSALNEQALSLLKREFGAIDRPFNFEQLESVRKLEESLGKFLADVPSGCKKSVTPEKPGTLIGKIELTKAILQALEKGVKNPCVLPRTHPFQDCSGLEVSGISKYIEQCRPRFSDDAKSFYSDNKGYGDEDKYITAVERLFEKKGVQ